MRKSYNTVWGLMSMDMAEVQCISPVMRAEHMEDGDRALEEFEKFYINMYFKGGGILSAFYQTEMEARNAHDEINGDWLSMDQSYEIASALDTL